MTNAEMNAEIARLRLENAELRAQLPDDELAAIDEELAGLKRMHVLTIDLDGGPILDGVKVPRSPA